MLVLGPVCRMLLHLTINVRVRWAILKYVLVSKISEYFDQLQTQVYKVTLVITVSVHWRIQRKISQHSFPFFHLYFPPSDPKVRAIWTMRFFQFKLTIYLFFHRTNTY